MRADFAARWDGDYEFCSGRRIVVISNAKHVGRRLANDGLDIRHNRMALYGTQQSLDWDVGKLIDMTGEREVRGEDVRVL